MEKYYSFLVEDNMSNLKNGKIIGGISGGTLGVTAGNIMANNLVKETKLIKKMIIESNSPEEAIERVKEIGTKRSLSYCGWIKKVYKKRQNDWKEYLVKLLNKEIIAIHGMGSLIGGYVGTRAGQVAGMYIVDKYL